jgi:hypothetical protein
MKETRVYYPKRKFPWLLAGIFLVIVVIVGLLSQYFGLQIDGW